MKIIPILLALLTFTLHSFSFAMEFSMDSRGSLKLKSNDAVLLESPEEGLWSVALDWENEWPSGWKHVQAKEITEVNGHTVVIGELTLEGGTLHFRDTYRMGEHGLHGMRRVEWHGEETLEKVTLSIRFKTPGTGNGLVMPSLMYHGNPNGENSGLTPVYHGKPGEILMMEEHRYPMPWASLEWKNGEQYLGAAMHSLPSPVNYGNQQDQWWSLGVKAAEDHTEFRLFSGPTAMNGELSVVKAHQGKRANAPMLMKYPDAYLNLKPGAVIEKSFVLQVYPVSQRGSGFMKPTFDSIRLTQAHKLLESFPTYDYIMTEKYRYAQKRWREGENYAGYDQFEVDETFIVWGWCGQAAAPGYAMQLLADEFGKPSDRERVQKSLDFLSTSVFYKDGFYTWYDIEQEKWGLRIWRLSPEFLSQGQGMWNMANAIRVGEKGGYDTSQWKAFLKKACDFYAERILSDDWNPQSTNEGFFIAPLAKASAIFGNEHYLEVAEYAADYYAKRHLSMDEPYWGGTLDASCEDKEGAFAAFQGFIALYEITQNSKYLEWAKHAGAVCLTYLQVWDIDLPAGRLRDHDFKTRGWTSVSVQNHHLDVYGVLIAPDVYRLGKYTDDEVLKETAKLMFRSCGQLIDYNGSQGEQVQQTFYSQGKELIEGAPISYRGDYVEDWTVFWITAHFINAAAQFKEMGVDL